MDVDDLPDNEDPPPPAITIPVSDDGVPVPTWRDESSSWEARLDAAFPPGTVKAGWLVSQLVDAIGSTGLLMPLATLTFKTKAHYKTYLADAYDMAVENAHIEDQEEHEEESEDETTSLSAIYSLKPLLKKGLDSGSESRGSESEDSDSSPPRSGDDAPPPLDPLKSTSTSRHTSKSLKRSPSPKGQ